MKRLKVSLTVAIVAFVAGLGSAQAATGVALTLTNRMVSLNGMIKPDVVHKVADAMLQLDSRSHAPIFLRINSGGGSVEAGYVLVDTMTALQSPIVCVVESKALSMAAMLTAYCDRVYMFPHATMMFHEVRYGTMGEDPTVRSKVEFNTKVVDHLHGEVARRLGLKLAEYRKRIRDEWWMTAEDALKAGVIDGIVSKLSYLELPKEEVEVKRVVHSMQRTDAAVDLRAPKPHALPGLPPAGKRRASHMRR